MLEPPYRLDRHTACTVLKTLREVSAVRDWQLVAAHVRTTHVHCIVAGVAQPNRAIADFKAYASRALNRMEGYRKRWAREGSTRRLAGNAAVHTAVRYVVDSQGDAMAVYVSSPRPDGTGL
jgi:REP element-mobilizing transposase RayT